MLQAGLDHIIDKFEVVHVCNGFAAAHRLGNRFVEVLLVVNARKEGEQSMPHVCELRLEELSFYRARELAAPHLGTFFERLHTIYERTSTNPDAISYLARSVLDSSPEVHSLRQFRRHIARRFGSTVGGWRRGLSGPRFVTFDRFRDMCQSLKCRDHAPELWAELDSSHGGCVSLFELDAEAVAMLVKFRMKILMFAESDNVDQDMLFSRLTARTQLVRAGQLEVHEFRAVVKALGIGNAEADRLFSYLDYQGGNIHNPPARVTIADFEWLRRLPSLIDIEAVVMASEKKPTELETARRFNLMGNSSRRARSGGTPSLQRNSDFALSARQSPERTYSSSRRSKSQEPLPSSSVIHLVKSGTRGSLFTSDTTGQALVLDDDTF